MFNGAKYLEKLINSLKSQSYPYFEVLFADDFSSDDSLRVILDNTKYDERFKIIALDSKKGRSSKVVNFLYKHVLGDFVIYFSQDDFCDSKFLELLIDKFDSQLVDAVIPYVEMYYEGFPEKNFIIGKNIDRDNFITGSLACGLSLNWSIPGAALFRKTLIDKCNGWDEWAINSDEYSTRKFFLNCRYVSFCDGIFYYRQSNPDAVTKKITVDSFEWPYTELMVYKMIKENGFSDDFKSVSLQRAVRTFVFYCDMLSKNIVNYEEASFNLIKCYNLAKELNVDGFFCSNFKD